MTTTTAPHPLYGPPLTEHHFPWMFYRVPMTGIGEDCDWVLGLGHVEPKRFVAAARNAYAECGDELEDVYPTAAKALAEVQHRWAIRRPECTWDGDGTCPQHEDTGCLDHEAIAEFAWWIDFDEGITEATPGAFPVTVLEMS